MRIAILADIHGNLTALDAVLADLRQQKPDVIYHGGDLAFGGCNPAEVIDCIIQKDGKECWATLMKCCGTLPRGQGWKPLRPN